MRILYPVGHLKRGCYKDGVINTSRTGSPSIWNVVLKFAEFNSDRAYFYIGAFTKSDDIGKVEYLPLKGINGCIVLFHIPKVTWIDLYSIGQMVNLIVWEFAYGENTDKPIDAIMLPHPAYAENFTFLMGTANRIPNRSIIHRPVVAVRTCEGLWEVGGKVQHSTVYPDIHNNLSYVFADKIFTTGLHMKPQILQLMKKDLSFARLKDVESKMEYISHGVPVPDYELDFDRGKVVGYFGRFSNSAKRTDKCFKLFDSLYKAGVVDRVIATSSLQGDKDSPLLEEYPYIDFSVERQDYVRKAQQSRCTITHFVGISCPLGMLEMMAYGVIPLVPKDKVWSQEFFKKEFPDYPFMFSNDVEAYAMVKLLMEDDSFYKKWARKLSKKVTNEYEIVGLKRKMYDSLERATNELPKPNFMEMGLDELRDRYRFISKYEELANDLGDEFTFDEYLVKAKERKISYVMYRGVWGFSNIALLRFLKLLGYEDTLDSPVPTLRRNR